MVREQQEPPKRHSMPRVVQITRLTRVAVVFLRKPRSHHHFRLSVRVAHCRACVLVQMAAASAAVVADAKTRHVGATIAWGDPSPSATAVAADIAAATDQKPTATAPPTPPATATTTTPPPPPTTGVHLNWKYVDATDAKLCRGDHVLREMIANFARFDVQSYAPHTTIVRAVLEELIPQIFGDDFHENKDRIQKTYGLPAYRTCPVVMAQLSRRKGRSTLLAMIEAACLYSMGGTSVVWKIGPTASDTFLRMVYDFLQQLPDDKATWITGKGVDVTRNGAATANRGHLRLYDVKEAKSRTTPYARVYLDDVEFVDNKALLSFLDLDSPLCGSTIVAIAHVYHANTVAHTLWTSNEIRKVVDDGTTWPTWGLTQAQYAALFAARAAGHLNDEESG